MKTLVISIYCLVAILFSPYCLADYGSSREMVYTIFSPTSPEDNRRSWYRDLLILALDSTVDEFGAYRTKYRPHMTKRRSELTLKENSYTNFIDVSPINATKLSKDWLHYIFFPVKLGFSNYRVCFHNQSSAINSHKRVTKNIIQNYSFGQGRGWSDVRILRHNKFKVMEVNYYEKLFAMTEQSSFDLFCRGIDEALDENRRFSHKYNLEINGSFALYYQQPYFFVTNKLNEKAAHRIKKGLVKSYEDGSLAILFNKYFGKHLQDINLQGREIIKLDNPDIQLIPKSVSNYYFSLN